MGDHPLDDVRKGRAPVTTNSSDLPDWALARAGERSKHVNEWIARWANMTGIPRALIEFYLLDYIRELEDTIQAMQDDTGR